MGRGRERIREGAGRSEEGGGRGGRRERVREEAKKGVREGGTKVGQQGHLNAPMTWDKGL